MKADENKLRALYSAALFWDAIETLAAIEAMDGDLPEEIWDEAEGRALEAKDALANEIKQLPRFNETRATRLVSSPREFFHLEERIPCLEGISTSGIWAEVTGRTA